LIYCFGVLKEEYNLVVRVMSAKKRLRG